MTSQASISFDAEYARVVKAVGTAQARGDDFERIVNACMEALKRAGITNDAPLDQLVARLAGERDTTKNRLFYADRALADMVNQYMAFPEGYITHEFMSAQEEAIDYLESIGWLRDGGLERYYWTETANDATKVDTPPGYAAALHMQLEAARRERDELRGLAERRRDELAGILEDARGLTRELATLRAAHTAQLATIDEGSNNAK